MKISKFDLIKQEGYQDMPEKDAIRLLKSRYIIEDLGMNQLEYEPRKKVDDFDWSYYQPLAEVRKHLGSQWKQKLDEKFKVEIVQFEDDEDDYIDAEPKLEEQQPAAPAQVIETQNIQQQNNIENQQNIQQQIINIYFDGSILDYQKGIEGTALNGNTSCFRYSKNQLKKLCATLDHGSDIYICAEAIFDSVNMNGMLVNDNKKKFALNAETLSELTCNLVSADKIRRYKIINAMENNNIIARGKNHYCMPNPRIAIGCALTKHNLEVLEQEYNKFKDEGVQEGKISAEHYKELSM